jgi:electron transport complex protein RnfD
MGNNLLVSGSPHIYTRESISRIMWTVVISLIPAGIAGVIIFGWDALWITLAAVAAAVSTELIFEVLTKKKITVLDGSAVITGILLAFNLPAGVPLWLPIVGAVFSMVVGKLVFGGLGQNIFNPALVGRVFLLASWPKYMTTFTKPFCDTVTSATSGDPEGRQGVGAYPLLGSVYRQPRGVYRRGLHSRPVDRRGDTFYQRLYLLAYSVYLYFYHRFIYLCFRRPRAF